ncbi:MAG: F0F1 ATP synthase subunit delta [Paenibacillaceae bacterium]
MSTETIVAKRYAKALFELAKEKNEAAQVEADLQAIVTSIQVNVDLQKFLSHPNIDASKKTALLDTLFQGKVSDSVLNTVSLLVDRRREGILQELLTDYIKIANEALSQAKAIVSTPIALSEVESQHIAASFSQLTGKKIQVQQVIDPSLLGGIQVRIGDRLYDGSLSGKLQRLQASFK